MTNIELNRPGAIILDACITVHKELGPGLLESVYVFALLKEFEIRDIRAKTKVPAPLIYKGEATGKCFEIDILVEDEIILEIKAVDNMNPVFEAQFDQLFETYR